MKKIKLLLVAALSGLTFCAVQQVHTLAETTTIEIAPIDESSSKIWFIGWDGHAVSFGESPGDSVETINNVDNPADSFSITENGVEIPYTSLEFEQDSTFQLTFLAVKASFTCKKENGRYFLDTGKVTAQKITNGRNGWSPFMGVALGDFNCSFHLECSEGVFFYNFSNFTIKNNGILTAKSYFFSYRLNYELHNFTIDDGGKLECFKGVNFYYTNLVNNGIFIINQARANIYQNSSFSTGENSITQLNNNAQLCLYNYGNNTCNGIIDINPGSSLEVQNNTTTINGSINNNGGTINGANKINDANATKRYVKNQLTVNNKAVGSIAPNITTSSYDLTYKNTDNTQMSSVDDAVLGLFQPLCNGGNEGISEVKSIVFDLVADVVGETLTFNYDQPQIKELLGNLGNYHILKFEDGKWVELSNASDEPLVISISETGTTTYALVGYSTAPIKRPSIPNIKPIAPTFNLPIPEKLPETGAQHITNPIKKSVKLGKTIRLTVAASSDTKITWTSKNKKIATVDKNGKVLGLKSGKTIITARYENITVPFEITVEKVKKSYTVKSKTTLTKLAKTLKVSVADLKKWNKKIAKVKTIKAKTKIVYYVNGTFHVPTKKVYKTTKKITLKQLAKQLKVSESNLKKWNKSLSKAKFVKAKVKVVYYL